jgi:uncharacterized protein
MDTGRDSRSGVRTTRHAGTAPGSSVASDVAFTPTVKAVQARKGSRAAYARMEANAGWRTTITPELAAFIARQTSFFIATANPAGQPYIQHRGGPPGFLKVIDERTLAFAEFRGNRQFITQGNLADNPRTMLFLIDYETRQRIKVWGKARVVEDDGALLLRLTPPDYRANVEAAILVEVAAWDANCPSHIPRLVEAAAP